jgi:hypothetical protein
VTAIDLVTDFEARSVWLSLDLDGKLVVDGPAGIITPEDLDTLRRSKVALVAYLSGSSGPASPDGDSEVEAEVGPPAPSQSRPADRFDPREFHDRLFARRIAIWTTAAGEVEWHDADGSLTAVDRAVILRHQVELARWLTTPPEATGIDFD